MHVELKEGMKGMAKNVFVHPLGYTTLIHCVDDYLQLYDEATMQVIGRSSASYGEILRAVAFCLDFNRVFCWTGEWIWVLRLHSGVLEGRRHAAPDMQDLAFCENSGKLVTMSASTVHFMDPETGGIVRAVQIETGLGLLRACHHQGEGWLFVCERTLFAVRAQPYLYTIQYKSEMGLPIANITKGAIFLIVLLADNSLLLLDKQTLHRHYRFILPFYPRFLTLYHPHFNTHSRHLFAHRIFIVLCSELSLSVFEDNIQKLTLNLPGPVMAIWTNPLWPNCVVLNIEQRIYVCDLVKVLGEFESGREWPCLGYRFQPLPVNQSYEEREDEYETATEPPPCAPSFEELNDWSSSLLDRKTVLQRRIKRLECL